MKLKVKLSLIKHDLTLQKIADEIGKSKTLVSRMLNDKYKGYEHRPEIARLLKMSEREIFGDRQERENRKRRRAA